MAVVVNDRQAFHVVVDNTKNRRLIEITVGVNERVTYKTVGTLVEAENKAKELRKFDPNQALELGGLKALNAEQTEAFEAYWKEFFQKYAFESTDDCTFWQFFKKGAVRTRVKQ